MLFQPQHVVQVQVAAAVDREVELAALDLRRLDLELTLPLTRSRATIASTSGHWRTRTDPASRYEVSSLNLLVKSRVTISRRSRA